MPTSSLLRPLSLSPPETSFLDGDEAPPPSDVGPTGSERVDILRPGTFEGLELVRIASTVRPWSEAATDEVVVSIATRRDHNPCHSLYRGRTYEGGHLRVLSPGEGYRIVPRGRCDWLVLRLSVDAFVRYVPREFRHRAALRAHVVDHVPTYDAFRAVHLAFARGSSDAVAESLLRRALRLLMYREQADVDAPSFPILPSVLTSARTVILSRIDEGMSLAELAHQSGLSREHLLRSFRRSFGMTPHQYLMHARVARARTLLAAGQTATRVTHEAGFCDQSHMNRWFKKVIGVTPGRYARAGSHASYATALLEAC